MTLWATQGQRERERGTVRETALVREGGGEGGYSGTLEPSDMTQMHWATVQRAVGGGGEGTERERRGGRRRGDEYLWELSATVLFPLDGEEKMMAGIV